MRDFLCENEKGPMLIGDAWECEKLANCQVNLINRNKIKPPVTVIVFIMEIFRVILD